MPSVLVKQDDGACKSKLGGKVEADVLGRTVESALALGY